MAAFRGPVRAQDDIPRLERKLGGLRLGERLSAVERLYPPVGKWPSYVEPKHGVVRIHIERDDARRFPAGVRTIWLGVKHKKLVDIQLIYDLDYTRQKPVAALVDDLSLIYGPPHRNESKFWWVDGKTVIRVFYADVPVETGGVRAVQLNTSEQVIDADLFRD